MATVLLKFNCTFARCAVKEIAAELAAGRVGNAARTGDCKLRADRFHSLFHLLPLEFKMDFMSPPQRNVCHYLRHIANPFLIQLGNGMAPNVRDRST